MSMTLLEQRRVSGLGTLYLARFGPDPARRVEFVDTLEPGLPKEAKWVMMVSTQVGCPVGCAMCDVGSLGFLGNLSAEEILDQVRHVVSENPGLDWRRHPKVKIHFARMGEPSLNPAVLEVLRHLARVAPWPGILPSISTVAPKSPAVEPFFEQLLAVKDACYPGGRFQLQFSVHSTDEAERDRIVPIRKWRLEEMAAYGERFVRPGDRKVTLNFALGPGSKLEARRVAEVFSPERFLVKITPVNPTRTADANGETRLWHEPPPAVAEAAHRLKDLGFDVVLSPSRPEEVEAATSCGQLWSEQLAEQGRTLSLSREKERGAYVTAGSLDERAPVWAASLRPWQRRAPELRPGRSALLVVDMQGLFLDPRSPAYLPPARAILRNVLGLTAAFRRAGRPVLFTVHVSGARDGRDLMARWWRKTCPPGSAWARMWRAIGPEPGERVYEKARYSAFTHPELARDLSALGVEDLAVAGVLTHLCVETTVRDAFDLGLQPFVALDATASREESLHLGTLRALADGFAGVMTAEEIASRLDPARREQHVHA